MHLDDYKKALANLDWFYQYSDDHGVWRAGQAAWNSVCHWQGVLDQDYSIWNQYCPNDFKRYPKVK